MAKKVTVLTSLVVILVILNAALMLLIFINSPHQRDKRGDRPKSEMVHRMLGRKLQFTETQRLLFKEELERHLDMQHDFGQVLVNSKQSLNDQLIAENVQERDSIFAIIDSVNALRERELYRHLKSIRDLCTPEQKEKLTEVLDDAFHKRLGRRLIHP